MLLPPYPLHERIRLIRIYAGMNQADMAQLLGMTQSWLSKLEAGSGELNINHLAILRQKFGISVDGILDGEIPYGDISKSMERSLKMPKRFMQTTNCRSRMLYGFISLYEAKLGHEAIENFFDSLRVPVEILAEREFRFSFSLVAEVISFGLKNNLLTAADGWREVANGNLAKATLGNTVETVQTKGPKEAFELFCKVGRRYSTDFSYHLNAPGPNAIEIAADHTPIRTRFKSSEDPLTIAMAEYHKAMLEGFSKLMGSNTITVAMAPGAARGTDGIFTYQARWE